MHIDELTKRQAQAIDDVEAISRRFKRGEISAEQANNETLVVMQALEHDTFGYAKATKRRWNNSRLLKVMTALGSDTLSSYIPLICTPFLIWFIATHKNVDQWLLLFIWIPFAVVYRPVYVYFAGKNLRSQAPISLVVACSGLIALVIFFSVAVVGNLLRDWIG